MDRNRRRDFLRASAALALAANPLRAALAQLGPKDNTDLVINNARWRRGAAE